MYCSLLAVLWIIVSASKFSNSAIFRHSGAEVENCTDKHSCKNNSAICKCDVNCPAYGDCCLDYPHINNSIPQQQTSCSKSIFLKVQCPPSWTDGIMRYKCENYSEISDPLSTVPVTSADTGNSYRNYYCAICDGVTENFVFWTIVVKCPLYHTHDHLSVEYLRNHFHYNTKQNEWGVWLSNDRKVFRKCVFDYEPHEVEEKKIPLRTCVNIVSECPPAWSDNKIREKCSDSFVPVFSGIVAYRNIYCAMCHKIDLKILSCFPQTTWDSQPSLYGDAMKLKPSELESVTVKFSIVSGICNSNQIYDPFAKKCRYIR